MSQDYSMVLEEDGIMTAHLAKCPDVDRARAASRPILTLSGCTKPLGDAYRKHECCNKETPNG